jgi:hypothetical protein
MQAAHRTPHACKQKPDRSRASSSLRRQGRPESSGVGQKTCRAGWNREHLRRGGRQWLGQDGEGPARSRDGRRWGSRRRPSKEWGSQRRLWPGSLLGEAPTAQEKPEKSTTHLDPEQETGVEEEGETLAAAAQQGAELLRAGGAKSRALVLCYEWATSIH